MQPNGARVTAVLAALGRGALGDGYVPEVPARMLDGIAQLASAADRKQLFTALRALDTRMGALALTGRPTPVSWLSPAAAEVLLEEWKSSRFPPRRALASGVIALAALALYGFAGREWERIGYPGPGAPPPDEPYRLTPYEPDAGERITCDAVIVGSGAGGGCVAAKLAAAGLDVVVLERGGYHAERDFTHLEQQAFRDMYLYGSTLMTTDQGVRIVAGATLGGGTVVNFATAFRTPDFVLREWADLTAIDAFVSGEFHASLDEVGARLGVNTDSSAAGRRDAVMEEGLKNLGWHVDNMPRAVRGCAQDETCGYCGFGCRVGAKQSSMRTYLEDAAAHGARLVVGADVRTVVVDDGAARGVEVVVGGDNRVEVAARAVIVAAGSIETPALLLRSGLGGEVGKHLHLHPGSAAFGVFDEDVRIWEGTTQARYSIEFRHWDGGYGPMFETIPVHPGAAAVFTPWVSAAEHRERLGVLRKFGFCGVLSRDRSEGRVTIGRDGNPRVKYGLDAGDERRVAEGVINAAKVMEAAGAREIFSAHQFPITYEPGRGRHEEWADETRRRGYRKGTATFGSWHQMGSCRMGTNPRTSVVGPDNQSHEVARLYVVDGSTFPTASGVNPMLTIYAIANRAAGAIAERLS